MSHFITDKSSNFLTSHMTTLGQIYDTQDVCCLKQRIQIREKEIEKLQKKNIEGMPSWALKHHTRRLQS